MADQQTDLSIVVEAINKASSTLKQVEKDLEGLNKTVGQGGTSAKTASLGFGELVAGVAAGSAIANITTDAFRQLFDIVSQLPQKFFDFVKSASEIEGLGVAMHVVANNAGITAEEVDKVRDSVIEQNVTTEAATRLLTDLIRKEVDYKQAVDLVTAAQNIAVASNMDSSEAVERISHAISTGNTFLLRELGIREDLNVVFAQYADSVGKSVDELDASGKAQAIVNEILKEGEKYTGLYSISMGNAAKVMRSLERAQQEIAYVFGTVFTDSLNVVAQKLYSFVNDISKWADNNKVALKNIGDSIEAYVNKIVSSMVSFLNRNKDMMYAALNFLIQVFQKFVAAGSVVFNVLQMLAGGFEFMARSAVQSASVIASALKGDWEGVAKAGDEWARKTSQIVDDFKGNFNDLMGASELYRSSETFDLKKWWDSINTIDKNGWEDRITETEKGGEKLTSKQKETLEKMRHDIEKENKDYAEAVAKRAKDFQESFDDLVIEHRDKIKELTADLEEENKNYKKTLSDLVEEFDESMDDIETRHKEKTESIKEDMEDERKKAEEEIEKITETYNEEYGLISKEGQDRISDLKAQLEKERSLGSRANQEKIDSLEKMIAYEEEGLSVSLDKKKETYDEEVDDVNEKLDAELEKLKQSLEDENAEYASSLEERKAQYQEDVDAAKESYEEKRVELQKNLDEELAIQRKYADDFARLADTVAADDLTRMVDKYNDEKAEAEREHQERLAEIKYQAFKGGKEYGDSFSEGLDASYPAVKSKVTQITNDLNDAVSKMSEFNSMASAYYSSGGGGGGGGGNSWAEGGVVTKPTFGLVGESGPEVILPLTNQDRMLEILKSIGATTGKGGSVTQNFYVTVNSSQDVDVLMERAGFAMRNQGGLS